MKDDGELEKRIL